MNMRWQMILRMWNEDFQGLEQMEGFGCIVDIAI